MGEATQDAVRVAVDALIAEDRHWGYQHRFGSGNGAAASFARAVVDALAAADQPALTAERKRIKRSMSLAVLAAVRSIPDGEIRNGCVIRDGAQVRERLRAAWLTIDEQP